MEPIIAYCGINCSECDAYKATANNDDALRTKVAAEWSKMYGFDCQPEQINCVGCLATEGVQIGHCSECNIRLCGLSKKVANCGHCEAYACDQLNEFHIHAATAKENLDQIAKKRG